MRILGARWRDGYLDEALLPGAVRLRVRRWLDLAPVDDLFFVRPRSPRLLLNYLSEVGLVDTVRKVASRLAERERNDRWLACGLGEVLEGGGAALPPGTAVVFVAPCHPPAMERVVLPAGLVRARTAPALPSTPALAWARAGSPPPPALAALAGWSPHSGQPLACLPSAALDEATRLLDGAGTPAWLALDGPESAVREREEPGAPSGGGRPSAVLFGLGNYAKTVVLPRVGAHLDVRAVHELDPVQLGAGPRPGRDTSPWPRPDERADAWLVAGYHHHHAAIAAEALRRGAAAMVEKPIATTREDLAALGPLLAGGGRAFACYQRRFLRFNAWLRPDLGLGPADPLSCHCIVYEVPLPARHWYRWPASRSRLTSNGCHWIDHFLFLNGFPEVVRAEAAATRAGSFQVLVELANGAELSMLLTDAGSDRLGLRDHFEVRAGGATAVLEDGSRYRAENRSRVVRQARAGRMEPYDRMYRALAGRVAAGAPGDDARSFTAAAEVTLGLEERLAPPR